MDDYIAEDNPVRMIDVFVDALDLKDLGFDRAEPEATGRPRGDEDPRNPTTDRSDADVEADSPPPSPTRLIRRPADSTLRPRPSRSTRAFPRSLGRYRTSSGFAFQPIIGPRASRNFSKAEP
jgi:hypothetical protein